ncbi:MAG TPA: type 4a pilus biogenesis protein PilO [Bacillota bacterium]|jgi:Tfp pilus assembly protein PilO|nr:type 4a pilus biogenesis protein PilO [Bacillota bacterium]HPZ41291.1 type 4a pilus biogenesis protein PilO [Bacillota bacterium]HQD51881.1 type 4a pilus biogenesis protein PilO [Bacillota bacterium]
MAVKEKKTQVTTFILIILLIIAAGVLYWIYFLKPALAKISDLREGNLKEEQAIAALEEKLAQKELIEQEWEIAREKESYLLAKVPEEAALPEVLGALEKLVFSTALSLEELSGYEFEDGEKYRFIPVTLRVEGKVDELLALLEKIEQFAHQTISKHVRLEDLKDGNHLLDLDFDLIFNLEGQDRTMGIAEEQEEQEEQD